MHVLAIVPARKGSKGIYRKNSRLLYGKPLIAWTFEAAKKSRLISRAIVTTDSQEIIQIAKKYDFEIPFLRPNELSGDDIPMLPVINHAVNFMAANKSYKPDYIILLQPTSPLRTEKHIDEALDKLISSKADSIVSVTEVPHNFNPYSLMKLKNGLLSPFLPYDEQQNLRQLKPVFYGRNGAAIYAFSYDCLLNKKSIYGDHILPYVMKKENSIDIDDSFDLKLCEFLMKFRSESNDSIK